MYSFEALQAEGPCHFIGRQCFYGTGIDIDKPLGSDTTILGIGHRLVVFGCRSPDYLGGVRFDLTQLPY